MGRITYADKVALNSNAGIPAQNKVNDTDMNNVKNAINQLGAYLSATVGANAYQFKVNLEGTLATGDVVNILFPTSTNTSNAQLSVNNGTNYYQIKYKGLSINSIGVNSQILSLYFDGTYFNIVNDIGLFMSDEYVIGRWINNKPIYRRIFSGTIPTLNPSGWVNLFQVADVEIPLRTYGIMIQNGSNYYELPRYENTNHFMEFSYAASTDYYNVLGNGWSGQGYIIIVEYTKTTD